MRFIFLELMATELLASAAKLTTKVVEETPDRWAFLVKELGMKVSK